MDRNPWHRSVVAVAVVALALVAAACGEKPFATENVTVAPQVEGRAAAPTPMPPPPTPAAP